MLAALSGTHHLMASLRYGSGLRVLRSPPDTGQGACGQPQAAAGLSPVRSVTSGTTAAAAPLGQTGTKRWLGSGWIARSTIAHPRSAHCCSLRR